MIFLFFLNFAFADTIASCEFYKTKSLELGCESSNYLTSFGYKYCRVYYNAQSELSTQSQEVFSKIRPCLIQALETSPNLTCENVKKIAKKSHASCYIESGYCELNDREKYKVYQVTWREGITPFLIFLGGYIAEACNNKY